MAHRYSKLNDNSTNDRFNLRRSVTYICINFLSLIAPVVIRRFIFKQFFSPRRYPLTEIERDILNSGVPFEIQVHEQRVKCWKWGKGQVILFAHGWNGKGIQFRHFFEAIQAAGYSVVVFDGPGHGESDGESSSYFQMTDTVRALINHYHPENIAGIIGHSFGAGAIVNALSKEKVNIPTVLIAPALYIKEILDKAFAIHGVPKHIYIPLIAEYERKYGYDLVKDNPVTLLNTYQINSLIIHDTNDKVIPFEESQYIASQHNFLSFMKTEGQGHKRILTNISVIGKAIHFFTTSKCD